MYYAYRLSIFGFWAKEQPGSWVRLSFDIGCYRNQGVLSAVTGNWVQLHPASHILRRELPIGRLSCWRKAKTFCSRPHLLASFLIVF